MTIASNAQRVIDAKAAIRQAIIDKGVEVPDMDKLDTYHEYIDQIGSGGSWVWFLRSSTNYSYTSAVSPEGAVAGATPKDAYGVLPACFIAKTSSESGIFEPDLSQVLDKAQLDNLQNIVAAGKASEYLKLGDELKISYDSYTMPFEVVGFEDVEVEGGSKVPAINLLAKYTDETGSAWGSSGNTTYSASTLRTNITTTYQNKLSQDFVNCLTNTKTQTCSRDGSTDVVYDKLFAPSMAQLGVTVTDYNNTSQAAVEGSAFAAYQGSDNAKRIKQAINATGTAQNYWTRSLYSAASNFFGYVGTSGAPGYVNVYNARYRVVVACNFIGGA